MGDDFEGVLERARAGSPEAFTVLYTELSRPVTAFLRSRGVREVDDVASEVFLAVFTGIGRFVGDEAQFRAWVFTIAHRRVVDGWRRGARSPATQPFEPAADPRTAPSAESQALDLLGGRDAVALLDRLTDDQREVLLLRIIGDLTVDQVSEVLGKRPGAVKAAQRRGLATLRRLVVSEGVPL
ncbi:sigma-70 family RNA polymerase sigma factor [Actinotalea sp. K2]|uniref:RNA polymerase sigma factor n=1 Tax=Actinotalea sp. K2 TaxID=2939438 RepID=UPI002017B36A|nr:sigma-70 family RNA polymerase sigma factor [Actinotalea sp. K2]MCL3862389.1 sigma-70 family RNA polymerase sigma factor [Actinotalea sp. K2]